MDPSNSKKRFSIILALVGAAIFILGVLFFAGKLGGNNKSASTAPSGQVVVWGIVSKADINNSIQYLFSKETKIGVSYVEVPKNELASRLANAIAQDVGPDLIISDTSSFYNIKQYTQALPYTSYPEASFKQSFAGITYPLAETGGIAAIPIAIDPVVMFVNNEILAASGYPNPPKTWADVYKIAPDVIQIEKGQVIRQALIPFGQYSNVHDAWAVLSALFLQSRIPIAYLSPQLGNKVVNLISSDVATEQNAGTKVLDFYTQFSDPNSEFYTWNRSMLDSQKEFLQGRLLLLPGFASSTKDLSDRNPNLNFSVSAMPQLNTDAKYQATYGNVYVVSILKKTTNPNAAFTIMFDMMNADFQKPLSIGMGVAPALNSLLVTPPETTYLPVVYKSALIARTWYNDNDGVTNNAFKQMVENVISGKQSLQEALSNAEAQLRGNQF